MASKFMNIRRITIPFLTLVILVTQITGCSPMGKDAVADNMQQNTEVVLELPDLDNQSQLTQQQIAELDIDWGEGPYPIYKYDWDYETDWKEILKLSNDDYQLELQYCEEKCPEKVITASYIDGYFEWKDEYVENQVRPEIKHFKDVDETVYATESVNIRVEPNADCTILGGLSVGQSIRRIGIGTSEGNYPKWSKVEFNGQVAYINSNYISTEKPVVQQGNTGGNVGNTSKPQTSKPAPSKPSGSGSGGTVDIQPIAPPGTEWIYQECNPDGTTPGEIGEGTYGDLSGITVE